jgi:hypothetical protein
MDLICNQFPLNTKQRPVTVTATKIIELALTWKDHVIKPNIKCKHQRKHPHPSSQLGCCHDPDPASDTIRHLNPPGERLLRISLLIWISRSGLTRLLGDFYQWKACPIERAQKEPLNQQDEITGQEICANSPTSLS